MKIGSLAWTCASFMGKMIMNHSHSVPPYANFLGHPSHTEGTQGDGRLHQQSTVNIDCWMGVFGRSFSLRLNIYTLWESHVIIDYGLRIFDSQKGIFPFPNWLAPMLWNLLLYLAGFISLNCFLCGGAPNFSYRQGLPHIHRLVYNPVCQPQNPSQPSY